MRRKLQGFALLLVGAAQLISACDSESTSENSPLTPPDLSIQPLCLPACVFSTHIYDPPTVTVAPNTSHSTLYTLRNTGNSSGTTALSCVGKGRITCGTITPSNVTLAAGAEGEVTVTWSAGACCTTNSSLILSDSHGGGQGIQRINIQ